MVHSYFRLLSLLVFGAVFLATELFSQTASPSEYPYVSPTAAAAGMTSGLTNGTSGENLHMMQVRTAARESDRVAAAAAIANQASKAIEEQSRNATLEKVRYQRLLKREAAERLKMERATAANAFNKVSVGELSSWQDSQGNMKLGDGVPAEYLRAVQIQEAAVAAKIAEENKKGFNPIKNITKRVNNTIEEPLVATGLVGGKPLPTEIRTQVPSTFITDPLAPQERPKVLKFKGLKSLKNIGGGRDAATPDVAEPSQVPSFATSPAASPPPQPIAKVQPAQPRPTSVGNTAKPKPASGSAAKPAPTAATIPARSAADLINSSPRKKNSLFSSGRTKKVKPTIQTQQKSQKPRQLTQAPTVVDAGLFPGSTARPERVQTPALVPKKKFALPKLGSSNPKPKISRSSEQLPTGTTVNRNGNSFYVVGSSSQFLKQKGEGANSIRAIGPGTVVRMTKSGDDWASVTLKDGSEGIIQTKHLRAAGSSGF